MKTLTFCLISLLSYGAAFCQAALPLSYFRFHFTTAEDSACQESIELKAWDRHFILRANYLNECNPGAENMRTRSLQPASTYVISRYDYDRSTYVFTLSGKSYLAQFGEEEGKRTIVLIDTVLNAQKIFYGPAMVQTFDGTLKGIRPAPDHGFFLRIEDEMTGLEWDFFYDGELSQQDSKPIGNRDQYHIRFTDKEIEGAFVWAIIDLRKAP